MLLLALSFFGAKAQTYCTTGLYTTGCTSGDSIIAFSTTGGTTNITNNNNGCGTGGYNYFSTQTHTGVQATTVNFSFTNNPGFGQGYKIWVDWNNDGTFADPSEVVYASTAVIASGATVTGSFTIPIAATPGTKRMRIRCVWNTTTFTACDQQTWGEIEDYNLTVVAATACSGTPTAGTATSSVTTVCPNIPFNLTLAGSSLSSGLSYQWQSSVNGTTWTNITGATAINFTTSQTATRYYRAYLVCSNGGASDTSTSVQVTSPTLFAAGTYTINGAAPASATNFQTFGAAISAMSCGIAGPVLFNVAAGTYNEQVTVPQILGTSSTNTVVFKGALTATISFSSSNSSARHGIWFNGADYVTFDSLNVNVAAGTYGWGVLFSNQSDSNKLLNCVITTNATSTSTNYIGIYFNGSNGTTFTSGANGNGNLVSGNTIIGGYYGIKLYGNTFPYNLNNKIVNNTIKDFYNYGFYTWGQSNLTVSGNDVSRPTRTVVTTTYGFYISGGDNILVEKNKVHDVFSALTTATTSTTYVYYLAADGTASTYNTLVNNTAYNITKTNGTIYGVYLPFYFYWKIYHNTIVLDELAATAGTTYGIYAYGTGDEVKNNIVYITRGGTGTKYALIYPGTPAPVSNNNVLYINSAAGTNYIGSYNGTNYATFANWQAANSAAFDQQSLNVDPLFVNASTGNLYPNNGVIAYAGAPLGVTTDIVNTPRNPTQPTPGAFENLPPQGIDVGITGLVSPIQKDCNTATETVTVTLRNYSANPINFATTPVTVNVAVTGTNATVFTPVVINSGTLASLASQNVVITSTYNMTAVGSYTFTATAVAAGDVNALNNGMPSIVRTVAPLAAGTLSSLPGSYCVTGGTPNLTLTGGGGGPIQWQESASATGPWTNVGTNSATYTPSAAITATRYYRVYRTCNNLGDTSAVLTVALNNPQLLSTIPAVRCGSGTVTLGATGSAGVTYNWYTAATGGQPIFTGTSYTTPVLSATTTYYVAATNGGSNFSVGLASDAAANLSSLGGYGMYFSSVSAATITSVDIYPSTAGTLNVTLRNAANTIIDTRTFTITAAEISTTVKKTLALNFLIPAGTTGWQLYYDLSINRGAGTYVYPSTLNGFSITGNTIDGNNITSGTRYYFYNWQISTGCESPRQAVTATINTAPAFDVTNNLTVCNNAITPLTVTTPLANYTTYAWSPAANLYTDAAATIPYVAGASAQTVYAKIATAGTFTFISTANNSSTACQSIDSVKVTVLPSSIAITPNNAELCVSGSATLGITPATTGFGAATYQWYTSNDNITFTPITTSGTGTTYTTPTIAATRFYRIDVKNSAGAVCVSASDTVKVNNPQILTTTPGALCGPGAVNLSATTNAGSVVNWYTAASGGTLAGTGTSFTTPALTQSTTYYAAAQQGGAQYISGIRLNDLNSATCGVGVGTTASGYALRFTTTKSVSLNYLYVIPQAAGAIAIELRSYPANALVTTFNATFTAAQVGIAQMVPLNYNITNAGGYQLVMATGGSLRIGTMGCAYPITTAGGGFSITGSAASSTAAANVTSYNSFYEISVTEACESARVAVLAQISSATAITKQPLNISTCVGATAYLVVGATGANLNYQWKKNGVNVANSNNDTLTLSPVALTDAGTYTVDITGLCGNLTSQSVTVNVTAANTWIGGVSSDWNTPANWCSGVPTPNTDVTIFAGTPYPPVINAVIANVKSLTISTGASVQVNPNGTLNVYGNFVNNGTFIAPGGYVLFLGSSAQTSDGMNVGSVMVNNAAGVTLTGNMNISQNLILTAGNLTLGINNLSVAGTVTGTPSSHIVTNSTGSVITKAVGTTAVTVPVGPTAAGYNPIVITNGSGRDYSVRVATGIAPAITNPSIAVNRTWTISASGATAPTGVGITFQYADADMNTPGIPTNAMEVGVHNGASWQVVSPAAGITPSGTPTARQVVATTSQFGPMVVSNVGGMSWITALPPGVDPTVSSMVLMPNIVESNTVLRVVSQRAQRINFAMVDANGRTVQVFSKQVLVGQNDIPVTLPQLAAGMYTISGQTDKGKTQTLRFVKL